MNDTFFKNIHISNFKSLKDVTLSDCKRINLLIGKPNVGKSNILEAIGLFSLPYFKYNKSKKLTQFVRLENIEELFFNGDIFKKASVTIDNTNFYHIEYSKGTWSNFIFIEIERNNNSDSPLLSFVSDEKFNLDMHKQKFSEAEKENFKFVFCKGKEWLKVGINSSGVTKLKSTDSKIASDDLSFTNLIFDNKPSRLSKYISPSRVKYYLFPDKLFLKKQPIYDSSLIPPHGINLIQSIQKSKIDKHLNEIFSEYGLNLLLDKSDNTLRIMKTLKEDNTMISFPYSSIADTLQRVIFFKTAIASNENSILLFEEPEAHCFPPYISYFTREVIYSETNQFFIATHSPYVLNDFLENQRDEVAIFIADFKDGQTVIYRLTDDEVNEVYNDGIDVFFNYEKYTQHG